MPQIGGAELIRRSSAISPETPIIVITAFGDLETAVEAMKSGAFDFITKPFDRRSDFADRRKGFEIRRGLLTENRRLRRLVHEDVRLENVVGNRKKCAKVFETGRESRENRRNGFDRRRIGHGQRARRARNTFFRRAKRQAVCRRQLRGDSRNFDRSRIVRLQTRRVHRRAPRIERKIRRSRRRHDFLDEICAMPIAFRPAFCAFCRNRKSRVSAKTPRAKSTCASSPRRTKTYGINQRKRISRRFVLSSGGRSCQTAAAQANGAKTFRC